MTKPATPAKPVLELSADDARRIAVRAQDLPGAGTQRLGSTGRPGRATQGRAAQERVVALVSHLGAVQLDTISVLARSHELVAYARLGNVARADIEAAYWGGDCFEYWGHAASILPIDNWPLFAFRRRDFRTRQRVWDRATPTTIDGVLDRLASEGPLTATELGGAKSGSSWWGWSDVKIAVEFLLAVGAVACVRRSGWRRVYDLPERVLPAEFLHDDLSDDDCLIALIRTSGRALGIGTAADIADYFRLKRADIIRLLPESGLVPVDIAQWSTLGLPLAWADPAALAELASIPKSARGRQTGRLLSPFDSLIWDRKRTARVFGFDHRLEAYVPKNKRQHGYFTMPILAGGRLIGRVDPAREGRTLIARQLSLEPFALRPASIAVTVASAGHALREAAIWVGCDDVVLERIEPAEVAAPLRAALS